MAPYYKDLTHTVTGSLWSRKGGQKREIRHNKRKYRRIKGKTAPSEARKDCPYPGETPRYSDNKLRE